MLIWILHNEHVILGKIFSNLNLLQGINWFASVNDREKFETDHFIYHIHVQVYFNTFKFKGSYILIPRGFFFNFNMALNELATVKLQ